MIRFLYAGNCKSLSYSFRKCSSIMFASNFYLFAPLPDVPKGQMLLLRLLLLLCSHSLHVEHLHTPFLFLSLSGHDPAIPRSLLTVVLLHFLSNFSPNSAGVSIVVESVLIVTSLDIFAVLHSQSLRIWFSLIALISPILLFIICCIDNFLSFQHLLISLIFSVFPFKSNFQTKKATFLELFLNVKI